MLLATYGEDESAGGADCQTIPVNNCRNVAKPNCRKIADEQCRKVDILKHSASYYKERLIYNFVNLGKFQTENVGKSPLKSANR